MMRKHLNVIVHVPVENGVHKICFLISRHQFFDIAILLIVLLNTIVLALKFKDMDEEGFYL
jgi:hypothetical protein